MYVPPAEQRKKELRERKLKLRMKPPGCIHYAGELGEIIGYDKDGAKIANIDSGCWGRVLYKEDGSCYDPEPISDTLKRAYYFKKTINKTRF